MKMEKLNFESLDSIEGLIPAIVQDINTKDVLMLAYMNKESLDITLTEKKVCFYSRSRETLWTKGETSGNILELVEIRYDCDKDTLLVFANPRGNVCHTGFYSCFSVYEPMYKKETNNEKKKKVEIMKSIYTKDF